MRISISCLRCRLWFDNLTALVAHHARHHSVAPSRAESSDRDDRADSIDGLDPGTGTERAAVTGRSL